MEKIEEMTNYELQLERKRLEFEHEGCKQEIVKLYEKINDIDHRYNDVTREMSKRKLY